MEKVGSCGTDAGPLNGNYWIFRGTYVSSTSSFRASYESCPALSKIFISKNEHQNKKRNKFIMSINQDYVRETKRKNIIL